ncbi:MAG: hypothetical protein AVDCRST_MAG93-2428, partial [uncultured Chloroflexia bacterium]
WELRAGSLAQAGTRYGQNSVGALVRSVSTAAYGQAWWCGSIPGSSFWTWPSSPQVLA